MMVTKFLYPYWGSENMNPSSFISFVLSKGFEGIEINLPQEITFETEFLNEISRIRIENPHFVVGLQQVLGINKQTPEEYLKEALNRLEELVPYRPNFINSHTGKDYFSFYENCEIIEKIEAFSLRHNIPVYHEIHRGRFTFHSINTLKYLKGFPNLKFVGDFSHWCVVSESLLEDQEETIQKIIPNIAHIHARVGTTQSSQAINPFAPEWQSTLDRFVGWWKDILNFHAEKRNISITPEFGPFPYMQQVPFTQIPMENQELLNISMRDYLKLHLL